MPGNPQQNELGVPRSRLMESELEISLLRNLIPPPGPSNLWGPTCDQKPELPIDRTGFEGLYIQQEINIEGSRARTVKPNKLADGDGSDVTLMETIV